jgi:hypothetical protein
VKWLSQQVLVMTGLAGLLAASAAGCGSSGGGKLIVDLGGVNGGELTGLGLQPGAGQRHLLTQD